MPGSRVPERERREQILQAAVTVAAAHGLNGLTVRTIADAAGISNGLVLFHYRSMDALRDALLDWLLARILQLDPAQIEQRWQSPRERLVGVLNEELAAARSLQPEIMLLLDFWIQGMRNADIRNRLVAALEAYRAVVRTLAEAALAEQPVPGITPAGFADVAVRSILGLGLETLLSVSVDSTAHVDMLMHYCRQGNTSSEC